MHDKYIIDNFFDKLNITNSSVEPGIYKVINDTNVSLQYEKPLNEDSPFYYLPKDSTELDSTLFLDEGQEFGLIANKAYNAHAFHVSDISLESANNENYLIIFSLNLKDKQIQSYISKQKKIKLYEFNTLSGIDFENYIINIKILFIFILMITA